ncbi:Pr6Pr family membrane protein [Salipiger sp.]|uniref:Pr6Pr family membrane protein n=1 Tax=Salipiger sp. TaxID=2078585 RepID=UPI003A97BF03
MTPTARTTAALVACLAAGALALQIHVGLERRPGLTVWQEIWREARYFTILTNTLVAATFAAVATGRRPGAVWSAAITLWIVLVGVVYHALLARELSGHGALADAALHTGVPLAVTLWWLRFAPKAGLSPHHAVWWLLWPAAYVGYALIRGAVDGRHPYYFLDPGRSGWDGVGLWVLALGAAFLAGGLAVVALARALAPHHRR